MYLLLAFWWYLAIIRNDLGYFTHGSVLQHLHVVNHHDQFKLDYVIAKTSELNPSGYILTSELNPSGYILTLELNPSGYILTFLVFETQGLNSSLKTNKTQSVYRQSHTKSFYFNKPSYLQLSVRRAHI